MFSPFCVYTGVLQSLDDTEILAKFSGYTRQETEHDVSQMLHTSSEGNLPVLLHGETPSDQTCDGDIINGTDVKLGNLEFESDATPTIA